MSDKPIRASAEQMQETVWRERKLYHLFTGEQWQAINKYAKRYKLTQDKAVIELIDEGLAAWRDDDATRKR